MFLDDLGAFRVKIGVRKALMVNNHKICNFCTTCALSKTVCVPTAHFSFLCVLGAHGRAPFLNLKKTNFFTPFYSELSLGVFIKIVDMDVNFHLPFV